MKFLKVIFSLAVALSFVGGIDAVSIKEARAAGKLKVKNNSVIYNGLLHLTWRLDSWDGLEELAREYPDLKLLFLFNNKLTSIPPEIGQLKNLKWLGLGVNKLTSIPPEIGQLKNLQKLYLQGNKLTSIPPEIGQLKNLTWLSIADNKLTSIPPEIGQLKNLQELDLNFNKLTSIPHEIGQLKKLRSLSLMSNRLNNAQALGTLAKMKWLKGLRIGNNRSRIHI